MQQRNPLTCAVIRKRTYDTSIYFFGLVTDTPNIYSLIIKLLDGLSHSPPIKRTPREDSVLNQYGHTSTNNAHKEKNIFAYADRKHISSAKQGDECKQVTE